MAEKNPLEAEMDKRLRIGASYDVIKKAIALPDGGEAVLYFIDGFVREDVSGKVLEYCMKAPPEKRAETIPYAETLRCGQPEELETAVMSGETLLLLPDHSDGILIDTRAYPSRSPEEPSNDRVLRGARDGFCEALVCNIALIRRRIRDPRLTFEAFSVGEYTRTDVMLAYIGGRADGRLVERLRRKLGTLDVKALNFGAESLAELLVRRPWWNPFPKIRCTERPDAACAMLGEGSVLILCDNTPVVLFFPTSFLDFLQETDDFCLPPMTATYLRLLRLAIAFVTVFLTPVWYLLASHPDSLPEALGFLKVREAGTLPLLAQLLLTELAIDGLKLAAMNTPTMLTSSLSVVGGLILGDFAVKGGWLSTEVVFYMAVTALANFTQQSYEMAYAFKFMRILLLLFTGLFGTAGFAAASALLFVLFACNFSHGASYLFPLSPFRPRALRRLLTRQELR